MVNFTVEQIRAVMENPDNIRNMSVIAHVDHGKSTLTDSLVAKAGLISADAAGNKRWTDFGELEEAKGITIKSTGVSLYYEQDVHHNGTKGKYLFNLIDSPGHVDFSSEVTAALRVTDGALVVVDCVEGVCVQTETVLRQAMQEKIKPVLFVNKIDKLFDLAHEPEVMYQAFVRAIDKANVVISTYEQPDMGDLTLHPSLGNVAFGAGKDCWGFTLDSFARMYSKKFNIPEAKMMDKLWGDNYYDSEAKKWKTENVSESGATLQRAFVAFILEPIIKLNKSVHENRVEDMNKLLTKMELQLTAEERKKTGKDLLKTVMSKWIHVGDCLIEMMVKHLPSPKTAQKYRAAYLYEGDLEDPCGLSIQNCDPTGPLMIYISKMIPNADYSRFMAFGRVFSGTVANGMKVKILPPNHRPGTKSEVFEKNITRTMVMMGKDPANMNEVPAGSIVALMGVDQHIVKSATITTHPEAFNIRTMKYSVSPVVRQAVEPKNQTDLPKLVEGLRRLSKSDQIVQVTLEENGQHVIAGTGELHLETVLHDLMNVYAKCPITVSAPIVNYRETITAKSAQTCLAKSANGHNRLFCTAEPLEEAVVKAIEDEVIKPMADSKVTAKMLSEEFGWDRNDAQKLWCFGPENTGANVIVDQSKGLQGLDEIRDSIETSFQLFTKNGALCEESLSGVRINIVDAMIHADNAHRGPSQIIQAARRVCYASQLVSQPRLQEPIYMAEIVAPAGALGGVYQCINARRGQVVEQNQMSGSPLQIIRAHLPVAEAFGFVGHLRALTAGQAFPQCTFDHWEIVNGNPYEAGSKVNQLVESIRKRKGLKAGLPLVSEYLDRL